MKRTLSDELITELAGVSLPNEKSLDTLKRILSEREATKPMREPLKRCNATFTHVEKDGGMDVCLRIDSHPGNHRFGKEPAGPPPDPYIAADLQESCQIKAYRLLGEAQEGIEMINSELAMGHDKCAGIPIVTFMEAATVTMELAQAYIDLGRLESGK